ncbi:hypothetical protein U1Q18_013342, partial [Sarracenia purpurea var. burkii]
SIGSFFRERSITLGSLMGVSSFLELSRRTIRRRQTKTSTEKKKNTYRSKLWLFSLCSKLCTDAVTTSDAPPSLGHLLEAERRAAAEGICRRNPSSPANGPYNSSRILPAPDPNSLFDGGRIDPARRSSSQLDLDLDSDSDSNGEGRRSSNGDIFKPGSGDGKLIE